MKSSINKGSFYCPDGSPIYNGEIFENNPHWKRKQFYVDGSLFYEGIS